MALSIHIESFGEVARITKTITDALKGHALVVESDRSVSIHVTGCTQKCETMPCEFEGSTHILLRMKQIAHIQDGLGFAAKGDCLITKHSANLLRYRQSPLKKTMRLREVSLSINGAAELGGDVSLIREIPRRLPADYSCACDDIQRITKMFNRARQISAH